MEIGVYNSLLVSSGWPIPMHIQTSNQDGCTHLVLGKFEIWICQWPWIHWPSWSFMIQLNRNNNCKWWLCRVSLLVRKQSPSDRLQDVVEVGDGIPHSEICWISHRSRHRGLLQKKRVQNEMTQNVNLLNNS